MAIAEGPEFRSREPQAVSPEPYKRKGLTEGLSSTSGLQELPDD